MTTKRMLYDRIVKEVGEKNVKLKACEELFELAAECGKAGAEIMAGRDPDVASLLSEIADVMVTIEQATNRVACGEAVITMYKRSIMRLGKRLKENDLRKGLIQ